MCGLWTLTRTPLPPAKMHFNFLELFNASLNIRLCLNRNLIALRVSVEKQFHKKLHFVCYSHKYVDISSSHTYLDANLNLISLHRTSFLLNSCQLISALESCALQPNSGKLICRMHFWVTKCSIMQIILQFHSAKTLHFVCHTLIT